MRKEYNEMRLADLTQRIATADTQAKLCEKNGKLIEARHWQEIEAKLQLQRLEIMEEMDKDESNTNA